MFIAYEMTHYLRRIGEDESYVTIKQDMSQSLGIEGKTCRVESEPPRATRARDEVIQRWPAVGAAGAPSRGPNILKLRI
jgi:hypothetical protein